MNSRNNLNDIKTKKTSYFSSKRIIIIPAILVLLLSLISFYVLFVKEKPSDDKDNVRIHTKNGEVKLYVEIADSPEERAYGLMFRTELAFDHGMLFIFPDEQQRSFWMKDTLIPLDIIFVGKDKTVKMIIYETKPDQTTETYPSGSPAQYVIEVNAGWCKENNVQLGDYVDLDLTRFKVPKFIF